MDALTNRYIKVVETEVPEYCPPNHDNTFNRRLLGPKEGSMQIEFIIGRMKKGGNASPHAHATFDQTMFMLEGEVRVTGDGPEVSLTPGDLIYFPRNSSHQVTVQTEEAKFIVLYSPPRETSAEAVNAG